MSGIDGREYDRWKTTPPGERYVHPDDLIRQHPMDSDERPNLHRLRLRIREIMKSPPTIKRVEGDSDIPF